MEPIFSTGMIALAALAGGLWLGRDADTLPVRARADLVRVEKGARRLTLLCGGEPLAAYRVALGGCPVGAKRVEGDGKTPEGRYLIDWKNPRSRFCLSLHISYPDADDRARAEAASPGGEIMIHGLKRGWGWLGPLHRRRDWTAGCVAVTNREIREIWRAVEPGTPIELLP